MTYDFEIFGSDQYDSYHALFERQENRPDDKTLARRRWWCFDNPNGGAFAVAKSEGKVVATCYLGGKRLTVEGRGVAVYEIGETATDAEHRRKGLFSALGKICAERAFERGGAFVYGTPNKQATPGWMKIGFAISRDSRSWLHFMPNVAYWAPMLARVNRAIAASDNAFDLSASEYVAATADFQRLNTPSLGYLSWRLADSPSNYRFLKLETRAGPFFCAVKYGSLGKYTILVCAEYFLNGSKPRTASAASLIRNACRGMFDPSSYAGIYFHAARAEGTRRLSLFARGVISHRELPVCLKTADGSNADLDFEVFQLSDCDIG